MFIDLGQFCNLENLKNTNELKNLFKIFHKDCLLKQFNPNDANKLNENFYNELLYILGLCEKKKDGKILILPSAESINKKGTLYYNILNNLPLDKQFLESFESGEINEYVLEILIIWINRILFLKLLESSIIGFNDDKNLSFLNSHKLPNFVKLNELFFKVLAKKPNDRETSDLSYLPYLNSSLFMRDTKELIYIYNLSDVELEYFKSTQIKDVDKKQKNGKQKWLYYLFEFLGSFDFGQSNNNEELIDHKELINSSVLGLVFEKLNGYKEGSFYTPSFITSYMCEQSLQKTALDKFNNLNPKLAAKSLDDIKDEILNEIRQNRDAKDQIKDKYRNMLKEITICDPAVGSGHFLVSALNYMIYIYSNLGLIDDIGEVIINNDELIIKDNDFLNFSYKRPKSLDSLNHKIQKNIFNLKRTIIENNLFGIDVNPNSVHICRLRLWIELLKNSYYQSLDSKPYHDLNTLPNIDINIKCGNSLISNFPLDSKFTQVQSADFLTTLQIRLRAIKCK